MRRSVALLLLGALAMAAGQEAEPEAGVWIEHFDKQSGKPFFYHSVSRETAWEAPAGAKVQYMNEGQRGGSGSSGGSAKASSSSPWLVTLALLLPIVLPMLGLLVCYYMASKEGLADVLKTLKQKRDRSQKRRSTKAGSNFRQRQKLSQDGKGGRSANS